MSADSPALAARDTHGLFLAGDSQSPRRDLHGNRAPLRRSSTAPARPRPLLAAEVLYGRRTVRTRPPRRSHRSTRGAALTGDYVFPGNLWGMLWASPATTARWGRTCWPRAGRGPGRSRCSTTTRRSPTRAAARRCRQRPVPRQGRRGVLPRPTLGRDVPSTRPMTTATRRSAGWRRPLPADPGRAGAPARARRRLHPHGADRARRARQRDRRGPERPHRCAVKRGLVSADELKRAIEDVRRESAESGGSPRSGRRCGSTPGPRPPPTWTARRGCRSARRCAAGCASP